MKIKTYKKNRNYLLLEFSIGNVGIVLKLVNTNKKVSLITLVIFPIPQKQSVLPPKKEQENTKKQKQCKKLKQEAISTRGTR